MAHGSVELEPSGVTLHDGSSPSSIATTNSSVLRDSSWTIPLVAMASVNVVSISLFEAFILAKTLVSDVGRASRIGAGGFRSRHFALGGGSSTVTTSTTVSRRHFFLGQALLLGCFGSSLVGFVFAAPASPFVCGVTRQLGVALVLAAIFAPLLVKCVFLVSLHGGVYLPSAYLALLLLFAVSVQLALGIQWLFLRPADIETTYSSSSLPLPSSSSSSSNLNRGSDSVTFSMLQSRRHRCNTSFGEVLIAQLYVFALLVGVLALSIRSRRVRDNYRESVYIAVASCCVLVVWVIGIVVALVTDGLDDNEDSCLAFALEATASIVFLVMFAPKGRQLAAMGREGLYVEDQQRVDQVGVDMMYNSMAAQHQHQQQQQQPMPTGVATAPPTPPGIYGTMRYPTFYRFNPGHLGDHRRTMPNCALDAAGCIYRIPQGADHKCHMTTTTTTAAAKKKSAPNPGTFSAHCRRGHAAPIYGRKTLSTINYGDHRGHQTMSNNSILY